MLFIPFHDRNPLRVIPFQIVTVTIIAICVVIFGLQFAQGTGPNSLGGMALAIEWGAIPRELLDGQNLQLPQAPMPEIGTLITSLFLHGGFMHLAGNMLYLWVFGDNVEDAMGHIKYLLFYLICGVAACAAHIFMNPTSPAPLIGASGAISGVLAAYLLLHPRVKILVLILFRIPLRLPAYLVLGAWIGFQFIGAYGGESNVAWYAHLGGFAAGLVLTPFFKRRNVPLFDKGRYEK